MKTSFRKHLLFSVLAVTALFGVLTESYGQTAPAPIESYTNTFDNDGAQPHSWIYWYGWMAGNSAIAWNGSVDAATNPASGSLELLITMTNNNQQVFFGTFKNQGPYDGSGFTYDAVGFFTNIEFDILVDGTVSVTNPATGDFGTMYAELVGSGTPNGGGPFNDTVTIPAAASNHWVHLSVPVPDPPPAAFYSDPGVIGVVFRMDSFGANTFRIGFTNHFYIDNLVVDFSGTPPPPPPPPSIASIARPLKNLNFYTTGSDYGRSSIRLQGTDNGAQYTWYNVASSANPVTYSYTLTGVPPAGHTGAGFHIYITPDPLVGTAGDLAVSPDFDAANCISITLDPNGTFTQGTLTFRSKTNLPNSNGDGTTNNDLFAGPKGSVTDTILGTWSCTFSNNTNVTLTGPSGASTNFNIDPNISAIYNSPIYLYWGVSPGNTDISKGVAYAVSNIAVTGAASTVDQTFVDGTPLDTVVTWEFESANGANPQSEIFVLPVEDEQGFIINWPLLNSSSFNLQTNSVSLTVSNMWATNQLPAPVTLGVSKNVFLSTNDIDPTGTLFFRLANPGF